MVNMAIFLPLYLYPINSAWENITRAITEYPDLHFQIVVAPNLANGIPDPNYITGLQTLNNFPNVQTLGYVPTAWASRDLASVEAEVATYASWANYTGGNIHVSGIFFDEAPSILNSDNLSYMGNATAYAKQAFGPNPIHVTLNPGVPVANQWYNYADDIIVFENTYAQFDLALLDKISWDLMNKSIFVIHNFTGSSHLQRDLISNLTDSNVGAAYITTQEGYTEVSGLWSQLCYQLSEYENGNLYNRTNGTAWGDDGDDDDDDDDDSDDDDDDDDDGDGDGDKRRKHHQRQRWRWPQLRSRRGG
jgi:hypothetical protein